MKLAIRKGIPIRKRPFPSWPVLDSREIKSVQKVVSSGAWGRFVGKETQRFERKFANYCGVAHSHAVSNGTVSLMLAMLASGIEEGDEVIVPPLTFLATATAVVAVNALPIFVDIEESSYNINPDLIEAAITPRTRAIIPVHFGGMPADMDRIMKIARKHKLVVIEDAAHAHGTIYRGKKAGALGDLGSFSFQSTKNMTSGEGGIVTTNRSDFSEACLSLSNFGRKKGEPWYDHFYLGHNYRITEMQTALLNVQLDRLDRQTDRRDANGLYLDSKIRQIPGLKPMTRPKGTERVANHVYIFKYDSREFRGLGKRKFIEAIQAEGIPVIPGYPRPLNLQPVFLNREFGPYVGYKKSRPTIDFSDFSTPVCRKACDEQGIWILQENLLGSRADMDDIIRALEKVKDNVHELV